MRDCDVPEPLEIDDEYLTAESLGSQPAGKAPLMSAFIACNRLYIIMEAVLDVHPVPQQSSFLAKASSALSGFRQSKDLREAESLLDEWCEWLPPYWAVTPETMASRDVVRITQAERLHCEFIVACHIIKSDTSGRHGALHSYAHSSLSLVPTHHQHDPWIRRSKGCSNAIVPKECIPNHCKILGDQLFGAYDIL